MMDRENYTFQRGGPLCSHQASIWVKTRSGERTDSVEIGRRGIPSRGQSKCKDLEAKDWFCLQKARMPLQLRVRAKGRPIDPVGKVTGSHILCVCDSQVMLNLDSQVMLETWAIRIIKLGNVEGLEQKHDIIWLVYFTRSLCSLCWDWNKKAWSRGTWLCNGGRNTWTSRYSFLKSANVL